MVFDSILSGVSALCRPQLTIWFLTLNCPHPARDILNEKKSRFLSFFFFFKKTVFWPFVGQTITQEVIFDVAKKVCLELSLISAPSFNGMRSVCSTSRVCQGTGTRRKGSTSFRSDQFSPLKSSGW